MLLKIVVTKTYRIICTTTLYIQLHYSLVILSEKKQHIFTFNYLPDASIRKNKQGHLGKLTRYLIIGICLSYPDSDWLFYSIFILVPPEGEFAKLSFSQFIDLQCYNYFIQRFPMCSE